MRRAVAIRLKDAMGLADRTASIALIAPWTQAYGQFVYAGRRIADGEVLGVTASFADLNKLSPGTGRFLSDLDFRRYYCVIGVQVAQAMRQAGATQVVGESIKLLGRLYTVVGVLQPAIARDVRRFNVDRAAFVPITTAQRAFDKATIRQIVVRMRPDVHHAVATREVERYFRQRDKNLNIEVVSSKQLIEQMKKQSQLFTLLLGAIGSISLIIGGVGVMNVMLTAVTERRREIGIRRALGANRKDIQRQFLTESIILSLLGGLLGLGLGLGASYILCQLSGWTFTLSASAIALGVGVGVGVGIFFGVLSGLPGRSARSYRRLASGIERAAGPVMAPLLRHDEPSAVRLRRCRSARFGQVEPGSVRRRERHCLNLIARTRKKRGSQCSG